MLFDTKRMERLAQQPFRNNATLPGLREVLQLFTSHTIGNITTGVSNSNNNSDHNNSPVCSAIKLGQVSQLMAIQSVYWNNLLKLEQQKTKLSALSVSIIESEINRISTLLSVLPACDGVLSDVGDVGLQISVLWEPFWEYLRKCVVNRQASSTQFALPTGPPI